MSENNGHKSGHRVFLGSPGYGDQTAGAARGFWRATRLPDERVMYAYRAGSLLAANFNALWCDALNFVHRGQRVDYFAMQHADVEPQDWWLDTLIDEMESRDLDMLGVVVPIKDPHGLTSLALDRPDGDTWRPYARLTMTEVFRLPETFTSEDVGHPLLLNTGLWVCRFDQSWVKKVHFTINDRIVFHKQRDRYVPECEPEDWYFSRLCHELKLRIGATRKISLKHRGPVDFPNTHAWGDQAFDAAWIDESPLPDYVLPLFRFPYDIPGWLTFDEGRELAELARGKRVLEIGSYCGLSTVCLARTAQHVVAVDPHDGRATPIHKNTLAAFKTNLERYGVADKVTTIVGTMEDIGDSDRFDLVFIDGAHDAASVEADIAAAWEVLAPGGLLVFHDYKNVDPDVTATVDAFLASGATLLSLTDSLAVVRPPALTPLEV